MSSTKSSKKTPLEDDDYISMEDYYGDPNPERDRNQEYFEIGNNHNNNFDDDSDHELDSQYVTEQYWKKKEEEDDKKAEKEWAAEVKAMEKALAEKKEAEKAVKAAEKAVKKAKKVAEKAKKAKKAKTPEPPEPPFTELPEGWEIHYSTKHNMEYYFDPKSGKSHWPQSCKNKSTRGGKKSQTKKSTRVGKKTRSKRKRR